MIAKHNLYPPIEPYARGRLDVGDGHVLYYEECGNPDGQPALMVHGGPGGGCTEMMRRFHDPRHYRIILLDQRGSGRSTPNASIDANTTWHLVSDMERLREHLSIACWQLCGGSWGSTLSLAYAEKHPERVTALILRGIFLLRRAELLWFYQEGCSWLYPDAWQDFERPIPAPEREDMIAAYHKRLTHADPKVQVEAAKAWSIWEGTTLAMHVDPERIRRFGDASFALAFARIECHYFINGGFLTHDTKLLDDARRIAGIPGVIVHGRYDVITPVKNAFDLKRAWGRADLRVVEDAGHAMSEPGIIHELVAATRRFAGLGASI